MDYVIVSVAEWLRRQIRNLIRSRAQVRILSLTIFIFFDSLFLFSILILISKSLVQNDRGGALKRYE